MKDSEKVHRPLPLNATPNVAFSYKPLRERKPYVMLNNDCYRANPVASGSWSGFGYTHG